MPRKRGPNSLTAHERRTIKALINTGLSDEEMAKRSGANVEAVTNYRQYTNRENARGTALTKTPLDYTVWQLSQRDTLTESQEQFLDIYQSETRAIWKRSWSDHAKLTRSSNLTPQEAIRAREVQTQCVAMEDIFGRQGRGKRIENPDGTFA